MAAVAELDLPAFAYAREELAGPAFHAELAELAESGWLARGDPMGWFVLDREAVAFFLRTPLATFPGRLMLELQGVKEGPLYERMKGNLLDLDGEQHRRLRRLVQPAFSVSAADRHRPAMRRHLEALFDAAARDGRCEVVGGIARPYPALMIAELMGAPLDDAARLGEWANLIQGQFDPIKVATQLDALERAATEFQAYAGGLLAERRKHPADDLLSELAHLEVDGDQLSETECLDIVSSVLVGAIDTTQSQLAHGVRLFAEHPEQWEALAEDPELAPGAAEEVLRHEPVTPFTARIAREDIEYRGVTFPKGSLIVACQATANRDPEAEPERPADFDIRADRARAKALTFGAGPHFCLGANLARAELQEALAFLAPRMPGLELDGDPVYDTPLGVYGMRELRVRFSA